MRPRQRQRPSVHSHPGAQVIQRLLHRNLINNPDNSALHRLGHGLGNRVPCSLVGEAEVLDVVLAHLDFNFKKPRKANELPAFVLPLPSGS